MAGEAMKQKTNERLAATLSQAIEAGEAIRASVPATIPPSPILGVGLQVVWLGVLVTLLATLDLGVLGILLLAIVGGGLVGLLIQSLTKRFALALTDRRLVWVPWNGKAATGPVEAEGLSAVHVAESKAGRFGSKLTLRKEDGTERRVTIPPPWREEAEAMAEALGTAG